MPKYFFQATYTTEGLKGLLKDGGTKRREVVEKTFQSVGGKLEAFYFGFGECDTYSIVDVPDNVGAAAASLFINSTGAVRLKTTVLLTPEEMDQATKKRVSYTAPGT